MAEDKILYLECYSGISGDMTVGALLDLGADFDRMKEELKKLPVAGYEIEVREKRVKGLRGRDFQVILEEKEIEKKHHHTHYKEIRTMLEESKLQEPVKALALKMFRIAGEAEAKVHGIPLEQVAFHEVGAVDSIVDIVAAAFCFCDLGIEQIAVSELWEGRGTVECQHGRIPIPVPAAAEIIKEHGLSVRFTKTQGEMITPTGAAIAAAVHNRELPEVAKICRIGVGTGKREFEHPNILRAVLLKE